MTFAVALLAAVLVVFETDKGVIEIEVDTARAPVTAANFAEVRRRTLLRRRHGQSRRPA
jgi:hypothetical protein